MQEQAVVSFASGLGVGVVERGNLSLQVADLCGENLSPFGGFDLSYEKGLALAKAHPDAKLDIAWERGIRAFAP